MGRAGSDRLLVGSSIDPEIADLVIVWDRYGVVCVVGWGVGEGVCGGDVAAFAERAEVVA